MRAYFAKVSIGTGFEPVLNWFQSTGLITQLQLPRGSINRIENTRNNIMLVYSRGKTNYI